MSIRESIEYVRNENVANNPNNYKNHAKILAEEVERLTSIIESKKNRYEEDDIIRDDIFSAEFNDIIYIFKEEEKRIVKRNPEDYPSYYISMEKAKELLGKRKAVRIPPKMYGDGKYCIMNGGFLVSYTLNKYDKGDNFIDSMCVWIPQPEKRKYILLSMRILGNDIYGDRIFLDASTSYYKSEKGNVGSYHTNNIYKTGIYKKFILKMLEIYRRVANRPNFLVDKEKM